MLGREKRGNHTVCRLLVVEFFVQDTVLGKYFNILKVNLDLGRSTPARKRRSNPLSREHAHILGLPSGGRWPGPPRGGWRRRRA